LLANLAALLWAASGMTLIPALLKDDT